MIYRNWLKRAIDILLAFLMFLILSPIFLILLISLSIHHSGSPFFSQPRPGKDNITFQILKFKTMSDLVNKKGDLLPDAERITRFGSLIRKTSLDEIPQLINVLKGDMSLVGPRPLLQDYLPLYSSKQARRHEVRPGVTGWAQVNGRNAISWESKFRFDVWYVDNLSFLLDLKILFQTLGNVLLGKGVTQQGQVSMKRFEGGIKKMEELNQHEDNFSPPNPKIEIHRL
ncbi:Sugar transferase involved in LPS biosynthesis (colanic, teichoic acid) [Algoriphagus locisalis]|uniref:Sugar transferase involved in LPS biosynthesis (Colanic, teichoic acid) n=1 Tax=Algoriphagus locisalis TaxID=305507 RepID=A0A1I6Y8M7_9BACT|nr:sugar transferase [Algoriphagus locisalis]SFT46822.1 Sugar transferase involved in LPS biosynthesis (colanic, teichoic acid) [Algoriphagus locisalis]